MESGAEANDTGNSYSDIPTISADGRYVAFRSLASDLVVSDTDERHDIFVRDVQSGITTLVSSDSSGNQGNGHSEAPSISDDGRFVAFSSHASNLVSGDTNDHIDIFVKDLQTGTITLVSDDSRVIQSTLSEPPLISGNGRYVVFVSNWQVFVKDLQTGNTNLVSTDSNGIQGDSASLYTSISDDGRYVAFSSSASNLVSGDDNGRDDIFVKDLQTGTTTLVSTDSSGNQGNHHSNGDTSISNDGRYVAFSSYASNLVNDDTYYTYDIFVKDLQTGTTTLVSTGSNGIQGNGESFSPSLSDDGRYVAFSSSASNLVSGDDNGAVDVFVKDLQTGATTLVSTGSNGIQGNDNSYKVGGAISDDGRYVTFHSLASNLAGNDGNSLDDVFVRDLVGATTTLVSARHPSAGENSVHIIDCPCGGGTKAVVVRGSSSADDSIDVKPGSLADTIDVKIKGSLGSFNFQVPSANVSKVIIYGLDGNDDIKLHSNLNVNGWLFGGKGNDKLRGGDLADILVGGDGDDQLDGKAGRDILIGGDGADKMKGQKDEDILIAGWTAFDSNLAALCAIQREWTSANSFEDRVKNVFNGSGGASGANGPYFFDNTTVQVSDRDKDELDGGSGADWFIADEETDGDKVKGFDEDEDIFGLDVDWFDIDP